MSSLRDYSQRRLEPAASDSVEELPIDGQAKDSGQSAEAKQVTAQGTPEPSPNTPPRSHSSTAKPPTWSPTARLLPALVRESSPSPSRSERLARLNGGATPDSAQPEPASSSTPSAVPSPSEAELEATPGPNRNIWLLAGGGLLTVALLAVAGRTRGPIAPQIAEMPRSRLTNVELVIGRERL
jgi:hypothetical protein